VTIDITRLGRGAQGHRTTANAILKPNQEILSVRMT